MLLITDTMSSLNGVLFSIDDILSTAILVAATASLLFVAIVKLRYVLLWCILPLVLSLAVFPISSLVTSHLHENIRVDCLVESGGDILLFSQNGKCVAFDFSDGTGAGAVLLANTAKDARCTELSDLVISHYHNRATYFINRLASVICVRNLRLPTPQNAWEEAVALRLCEEAELLGIQVCFDLEDLVLSELSVKEFDHALFASNRHPALLLSVFTPTRSMTYINASVAKSSLSQAANDALIASDIIVIGGTGFSSSADEPLLPSAIGADRIYITDEKLLSDITISTNYSPITESFGEQYRFHLN